MNPIKSAMAANNEKSVTVTVEKRDLKESIAPEAKTARIARFAEATSVHSPIDPPSSPPKYPTNHYRPQPQVSDLGFDYLPSVEMEETDRKYLPPPTPKTPLRSALKSPGAPPRTQEAMILSPTFREEQQLEKHEALTEREQQNDLKIKVRVRIAKLFLRGINFACSLIVISMLATVFSIFNATKNLAPRSARPPWAEDTKIWPQILLLVIACISLVMSIIVIIAYTKGGHRRAEKVAAYYTVFAVGFFVLSIVIWAIGAAVFNQSKAQGNGKDMWGWSCLDNRRRTLFEEDVDYELICRLQNWSLVCCIIEVFIETLCIIIYAIVFYRFYSKRKLRKSMAVRDKARSDLYLAQLRSQSAPNTPAAFMGAGPLSPRSGGWRPPLGHPAHSGYDSQSAMENGEADKVQFAYAREITQPQPFSLQSPPIKIQQATPHLNQASFEPPSRTQSISPPMASPAARERQLEHVGAAPGEQQYASVPIPGAYVQPMASPAYPTSPSREAGTSGFDFGPDITRRP